MLPGHENPVLSQPNAAGRRAAVTTWGWGDVLVACGSIACIASALFLPWAKAGIIWRSILTEVDMDLGTYSFSPLDMPWLATLLIAVAVLCIIGLAWRKQAGTVALIASILLLAGSAVYLVSLIGDAYDFLGFVNKALELVRGIPFIGPVVEAVIRERLSFSAWPQAGVFLFMASTLLILSGGLLIRRRGRARQSQPLPEDAQVA